MSESLRQVAPERHRVSLETARPRMAKVDLEQANARVAWRRTVGRTVGRAFALAGLSQKEVAGALDLGQAQISRWVGGTEHAQLDRLMEVEAIREPLVIALASLAGFETETRITKRRTA